MKSIVDMGKVRCSGCETRYATHTHTKLFYSKWSYFELFVQTIVCRSKFWCVSNVSYFVADTKRQSDTSIK